MQFYTAVDPHTFHTAWCSTQAEARAVNPDFTPADVPTSKPELLKFLNDMQNQIDVLRDQLRSTPPTQSDSGISLPSYTEISISFEDAFEEMPLALQLHYAALAMENARAKIKS